MHESDLDGITKHWLDVNRVSAYTTMREISQGKQTHDNTEINIHLEEAIGTELLTRHHLEEAIHVGTELLTRHHLEEAIGTELLTRRSITTSSNTYCCLFDLACFFLPSFSSLIKTCIHPRQLSFPLEK